MIVAHDLNYVIGKDNDLIWHIPEDLKYFKKITMNKRVVMGRKTFESIGKLLPNRINIIITSDYDYKVEGAIVYNSLDELRTNESEYIIIGGTTIYEQLLNEVDVLFATVIEHEFEGDSYFPKYNHLFDIVDSKEVITSGDQYSIKFNKLVRK